MAQHTPGPWRADLHHTKQRGGLNHGYIIADSIVPLAAVVLGVEGVSEDEGRANARLIAAAPSMLAALKRFEKLAASWADEKALSAHVSALEAIQWEAQSLIAKATGEARP